MRLKYNILVFEDTGTYADSLEMALKEFINDNGFELSFKCKADGTECEQIINTEDIDLVLIDLNLGSGNKGDAVINKIRDNEVLSDIIFYSNDETAFEQARGRLSPVEGVYFQSGRAGLLDKVKTIINLTIKKNQDIINLRGLVIAETTDLEAKMEDIIIKYFEITEEKFKVFAEHALHKEFFTTSTKNNMVNAICSNKIKALDTQRQHEPDKAKRDEIEIKMGALRDIKTECGKIQDEVIAIRNTLAHVKESTEIKNTIVSTRKGCPSITINDEWCKKTRKDLRKHSDNLDKFLALL